MDENKEIDVEKEIDSDESSKKDEKKSKKEKIEYLESQVAYWKNKYYEAYADMDNLRKHIEKDHAQVMKYRSQGFLEALLPSFDNFYNCFKFKPSDPTLAAYCKGFEMIYNQMSATLENEGVKEIVPSVGDKFDHTTMQAVEVVEGEEDDLVTTVQLKGYMLKDRLVRPAMVVVSKIKKEEKDETSSESQNSEDSKIN
ncbi:MAG: nucleotide exchange factor GrpE [Bacilli bacterium]|nr:nucleotide exchange factor GrpE [Erysipelotrichaceae bacterium]MDD6250166.1 nucleotide exchange factor GrpE [Bacillales bacterium]MDY2745745.1 nucleotide exchange factor GrpE [Bacilli bacterium]MDD7382122.1 nucleotide exchange factor GrpE [Bacillales bacterium]MDY3890078.1 nucleotide exchange factor GrpE [Bacilli bacterium]